MSDGDEPVYLVMLVHGPPDEVHIKAPNNTSLTLCGKGNWYTKHQVVPGEDFEGGPCLRCLEVVSVCTRVNKFLSREDYSYGNQEEADDG